MPRWCGPKTRIRESRLHNRLKDVDAKARPAAAAAGAAQQFVDWVADYTLSARGMVLRMALRMGEHLGPGARAVSACGLIRACATAAHDAGAAAADRAADRMACCTANQTRRKEAGVSAGVIDGLVDEGTLETLPAAERRCRSPPPDPDHVSPFPTFQPEQRNGLRTRCVA